MLLSKSPPSGAVPKESPLAEAVARTPTGHAHLTAPQGLLPFPAPHSVPHLQCPVWGHRNQVLALLQLRDRDQHRVSPGAGTEKLVVEMN